MPAEGTPHQAILYYTPPGPTETLSESVAEGPSAKSEHEALAGLLSLLSGKLGERKDEVLKWY